MMEPQTIEDISGRAKEEIELLFNVYRIARLNVRYYGCRAELFANKLRKALIVITALSAIALAILMIDPPGWAKAIAIVSASLAAIYAAVLPTLGWSECQRDLHFLYVAYGILFGQIEGAIAKIKKTRDLTPHLAGVSDTLHETFHYLEVMDERSPDRDEIKRLEQEVNEELPPTYVWTHM